MYMRLLTKLRLFLLMIAGFGFGIGAAVSTQATPSKQPIPWWPVQAIDTMKYSRDNSGQYLQDLDSLREVADWQLSGIAKTGATHVAIATPYDEAFLPVLRIWVELARAHDLHVWFRGNWSGWEEWFDYPAITRQQHLDLTREFILKNPTLFADGDIFSACPECENGGPGDPRMTGDVDGFRQFLIDEHTMMAQAFAKIGRSVTYNYNSMNGDVAKLIMDEPTTAALGGVVTIDHYVKTPEQLVRDVEALVAQSHGKVVIGEVGAPVPDIHGQLTQEQQAAWIAATLQAIADHNEIIGVSYWTNQGGSTALWNEDGTPRTAVQTVTDFFTPRLIRGQVVDSNGHPIRNARVQSAVRTVISDDLGLFSLPVIDASGSATVQKDSYLPTTIAFDQHTTTITATLTDPPRTVSQRLRIWATRFWESWSALIH